ncbi:MAG: DNA polymerase Y family protein [Rhodoplanes sp.]
MSAPSIPSRYLSIWLRRLATDRLTRRRVSAPDEGEHAPLVVAHMVKSALRIAAMNDAAAHLGLTAGLALADARARHPALEVAPSDPAADRGLLDAIADWCDRYTPLVGIDAPAGVMLDVAGCTHLFGGEAAFARDIVTRLAAQGLRARVGIADTPGCAWAVARYGAWADMPVIRGEPKGRSLTSKLAGTDSPSPLPRGERSRAQRAGEGGRTSTDGFEPPHPTPSASTSPRRGEVKEATSAGSMYSARAPASRNDEDRHVVILPPGGMREALAPLPLAALRLEPETVAALADVGLNRIADVLDLPRATLAARFDVSFLRRLDQALGREDEPITPKRPAPSYMAEQHFAEPIARERDVLGTIARLSIRLGYAMEARGEGARLVELALFRTDGKVHRLAVGAGAPVHEANRISRLFADRLAGLGEACDPGFGYDLVRLSAPVTERCAPVQTSLAADRGAADHAGELGHLIDRLGARFGLRRVTRLAPQDTHIPEFAVAAVPAHAHLACAAPRLRGAAEVQAKAVPERDAIEPATQDTLAPARPARLFARPERIEAIAEVPDGPPVRFRWRRVLHEVMAAEGPERIALEWWRDAEGSALTRDYFRIETRAGMRVWLYREGLYGRETDAPRWFLHGLFG